MTQFTTLSGLDVSNTTVLVRTDLNVPMEHGKISDTTRVARVVPTLQALLKQNATVVVLSHFGRPKGTFVPGMSLAPLVDALSDALGTPVKFGVDCVGEEAQRAVDALQSGEVLLLENLRFHKEEESNDPTFARELASLGDVYVNDAFSCSHRAHASIVGIPDYLPAAAGLLMQEELDALTDILRNPEAPVAAVVGGSKISTKLELLDALVETVDVLVIGGGMANTFLAAQGYAIGQSLYEKKLVGTAKKILTKAPELSCEILLPEDVVAIIELTERASCQVMPVDKLPKDRMIIDIGPKTAAHISRRLADCKTVVWNGPMGAFEYSPFDVGTISVARTVAGLTFTGKVKSIAGGGDTVSALARAGLRDSFTYLSTSGGAFLEWLEGKTLPGVEALERAAKAA